MGDRKFDWDDANQNHLAAHDITPQEAEELFQGFYAGFEQDPVNGEPRFLAHGMTAKRRFLTIAYTERHGMIRPITGWDMTKKELVQYVKELHNQQTQISE